jgi:hypothetical protein
MLADPERVMWSIEDFISTGITIENVQRRLRKTLSGRRIAGHASHVAAA